MVTAVEILLAAGIALVAASFVAVVLDRISDRLLVAGIALLAGLAGAAGTVLVVGLATDSSEWEQLLVAFAGLVAATAAEAGALGLSRGLRRLRSVEDEQTRLLADLDAALADHAERRMVELERTLTRERAEAQHLLAEQERRLREERRVSVEAQVETARTELVDAVSSNQQRLEQRLSAWASDLERAQQQLKARLEELIRHQADALREHELRLAEHAAEVESLEELQSAAIARVRADLERAIAQAEESVHAAIETHAGERRRALHEVGERLRARERAMREQIEREENDGRTRLLSTIEETERRHLETLERMLDRAVVRLSEEADRRFDNQLRESREKTAERLNRELELSMDAFTRSAEKEVAARIAEAAQSSAVKLQRQIDDVVRAAEAQTTISNERIKTLTERLEQSLDAANDRLAAFEANVELELATKLGDFERTLRSAEQAIERERA